MAQSTEGVILESSPALKNEADDKSDASSDQE